MGRAIGVSGDFTSGEVRQFARRAKDGGQARRLLAIAAVLDGAAREEARRLREDPSAIEDLARRELGLIKPGEKLFIVKDIPPEDVHRKP